MIGDSGVTGWRKASSLPNVGAGLGIIGVRTCTGGPRGVPRSAINLGAGLGLRDRTLLTIFCRMGRKKGMEAAMIPVCCSTCDQMRRFPHCRPDSSKLDSHRMVMERRTADAPMATIPRPKMATSSMRRRTGMDRRLMKKGIGRSQTMPSVARLNEAWVSHSVDGLRHLGKMPLNSRRNTSPSQAICGGLHIRMLTSAMARLETMTSPSMKRTTQ